MFSLQTYLLGRKGQGTVEFAFALPILVLAFFAIVEFTHLFYTQLTLRQALRQAGRYMVTGQGQIDSDPDTSSREARIEAIKTKFCNHLMGTGLGGPSCKESLTLSPASGGEPGETVTLTATFSKPWFTVGFDRFAPGGVSLSVSTTWVNYQYVKAS